MSRAGIDPELGPPKWSSSNLILNIMLLKSKMTSKAIQISLHSLIYREVAAATVGISYGVVIGKLSPLQTVGFVMLEVPFYHINEWIAFTYFQVGFQ